MRHAVNMIAVLGLVACSKGDNKAEPAPAKTTEGAPTTGAPAGQVDDASAEVGIGAGGITYDGKVGAAGVVTSVTGPVEVRRLGETAFAAAKAETSLHAGDVVRTGEAAQATVMLADQGVVEVAEVSTIAIASRAGSADPASSAAVLSGVARFTVTPRAPGEGAFRVYTPAGVVLTKGTVYGVGVAASGEVRVGVESGAVEVIGLAEMDAVPVVVEGGAFVVLGAQGAVASPSPWPADDWGTWRDEADAKLEVGVALDAHGAAMTQLAGNLKAAYADLDASADAVATFEANAAASAAANDTATYEASLPEGGATIAASFGVAGRLELLTWAYASHATIATDLHVRHPKLEAEWTPLVPRVDAAVLWPKRFEVTAAGYLEPLRVQYYVHHPRGRIHAPLVGVTVPAFYATVEPPELDPVRVRGRVRTKIWIAPEVRFAATTRPIWIGAPAADWRVKVKVSAAPPRANARFYVRPPSLKATLLVGTPATASWTSRLTVAAPEPRVKLRAAWHVPVGVKIKVASPDFTAAAKARSGFQMHGGAHADAPDVGARGKVRAQVGVPDVKGHVGVKVGVPDVKASLKIGGKAAAGAGHAGAQGGAAVKVKVKAPAVKVKVKAPAVKVKAKGKIKFGL